MLRSPAHLLEAKPKLLEGSPLVVGEGPKLAGAAVLKAADKASLAKEIGKRKPRLFERDYGFPSPFNTYLQPGLPPGPVGAPSSKSMEAVLDPVPVPA